MAKNKKPDGGSLSGKISDRIQSGKISKASVFRKTPRQTEPKASSILSAFGRGLGNGAARRRNGGTGGANDGQA